MQVVKGFEDLTLTSCLFAKTSRLACRNS